MASHCLSCPSFSFASLPTGRKLGVGPSLVGAQLACPPIRLYVPAAGAPCGDFPAAPSRSSAAAAAAEHGMALPESPAAPSLPAHQSGSANMLLPDAALPLLRARGEVQREAAAFFALGRSEHAQRTWPQRHALRLPTNQALQATCVLGLAGASAPPKWKNVSSRRGDAPPGRDVPPWFVRSLVGAWPAHQSGP